MKTAWQPEDRRHQKERDDRRPHRRAIRAPLGPLRSLHLSGSWLCRARCRTRRFRHDAAPPTWHGWSRNDSGRAGRAVGSTAHLSDRLSGIASRLRTW